MKRAITIITAAFILLINITAKAQWVQVGNGLQVKDKRIYSIANLGNDIYAGTADGRIYRSENSYMKWSHNYSSNVGNIYSIATFGNYIYAGGGHGYMVSGGIIHSTNNGMNWSYSGLSGQVVYSIEILGINVFAGTENNGVFITTNNGNSWVQTALNNKTVNCLASLDSTVFAGTNTGVFISTNLGVTWTQSLLPFSGSILSLATLGNTIFAGTNYGIAISTNNGMNWTTTATNSGSSSFATLGNNIYASHGSVVLISTNNGVSWENMNINDQNAIHSLSSTDNQIFAATYNNTSYLGSVFISDGYKWTSPPSQLNVLSTFGSNIYAGTNNDVFLSTDAGLNWSPKYINLKNVRTILSYDNFIFAGILDSGIYCTTNNGINWVQTSLNNKTVNSLVRSNSNLIAGTSNNGIYYSTNDGANWIQTSLNDLTINTLHVLNSNIYAGTILGGVYISTNNGLSWSHSTISFITINTFAANANKLYAGTNNQGIYYTTNNGINWIQTTLNNRTISSLAIYGNSVFAGAGGTVYYSQNDSLWTTTNFPYTGSGESVKALTYSNGYILAGTDGTGIYRRYILEFAPIRGDVNLDSLVNVLDVTSVVNYILGNTPPVFNFKAADVNNDNLINVLDVVGVINIIMNPSYDVFAGNNENDNSGSGSLSLQNSSLMLSSTVPVSALQFRISGNNASGVTFTPNTILNPFQVVGGNQGDTSRTFVIYSMNNSLIPGGMHNLGTFSGLNSGMTLRDVIIADSLGSNIVTGTGNEMSTELPKEYSLSQNYPNPFNPKTAINFQLPKSGMTKLNVYDITGRLIKTLVNEFRNAGYYEEVFDASMFSSGAYFYRLEAGDYAVTKKMIILK